MLHRIFEVKYTYMKVTALIPDGLIGEVKKLTGGSTITESLIIALEAYASHQRLLKTMQKIKREPLIFRDNYSAAQIRKLNRER